jgi:hypothetical protein
MKRSVAIILLAVMIFSYPTTAKAAEKTSINTGSITTVSALESVVTPYTWYYSKTAEVTLYYALLKDVPSTYYYRWYDSGMGVYLDGYLPLISVTLMSDGRFKAYYSGTIGTYIY